VFRAPNAAILGRANSAFFQQAAMMIASSKPAIDNLIEISTCSALRLSGSQPFGGYDSEAASRRTASQWFRLQNATAA
jgi:hypothetical protein